MRESKTRIFLPALMVAVLFVRAHAAADYKEVKTNELKASVESYKGDKIVLTTNYLGFRTTFFTYMDKSGFDAGKALWIIAQPEKIPVMTKKKADFTDFITNTKKNSVVRIYGKIKKFKRAPKNTLRPHYYIELEKIEPVADKVDIIGSPKDDDGWKRRRKERQERRTRRLIDKSGGVVPQ